MAQDSLIKYIREQIRAGYDTGSIKGYLLKYGYPESRINEALQQAYPPSEVRHVVHPSRTTIALIVAIVCSLLIVSGALYFFLQPKSQLLDVETDLISDSIITGGELKFNSQIFNLGKARGYDVTLRYEIYTLGDQLVKFKEETIALETRAASSVSISLGDVAPGSYYLRTTATYDGKTARATSSFRVTSRRAVPIIPEPEVPEPEVPEPEVTDDRCPTDCDDSNECTTDYCDERTGYNCMHDNIPNCCGNGLCESGENYENCLADCEVPKSKEDDIFEGKPIFEKIEMISDIGNNDKDKAVEYCNTIEQTGYKYDCFSKVAVSANDEDVCLNIGDQSYKDTCYKEYATTNKENAVCALVNKDSKRDQCYMAFATKGDYTVCDKLVNKYLKQSCESLKKLSEVNVPSV